MCSGTYVYVLYGWVCAMNAYGVCVCVCGCWCGCVCVGVCVCGGGGVGGYGWVCDRLGCSLKHMLT